MQVPIYEVKKHFRVFQLIGERERVREITPKSRSVVDHDPIKRWIVLLRQINEFLQSLSSSERFTRSRLIVPYEFVQNCPSVSLGCIPTFAFLIIIR